MAETVGPRPGYFGKIGEGRYKPTAHVGGAWRTDEQHFSPLGGLIVHAIEEARAAAGRPDLLLSRISFDILGQIGLEDFDIHVETVRPGKTIELTEATVVIGGRAVVRARAWLLAAVDTDVVAGGGPASLTPPEQVRPWAMDSVWSGGFIESLHTRVIGEPLPGRTTAWVRTGHDLVAGEQVSSLASFVALIDTANGIAVRQDPTRWMFPNVDLTIHLHRQPEGEWTGLDTSVTFGSTGQGLTSTELHDISGPVGRAEQILTVRPLAT